MYTFQYVNMKYVHCDSIRNTYEVGVFALGSVLERRVLAQGDCIS